MAIRIQAVIATGETTTVKLTKAVPVRLMYLTATPSAGGIACSWIGVGRV